MKKPLHLIIGSGAGITGCAVIGALSRAEMALHVLENSRIEIIEPHKFHKEEITGIDVVHKERSIGPTLAQQAKNMVIPITAFERYDMNVSIRPSHKLDKSSFITGKKLNRKRR